jgi:hypothetical protein
MTRLFSVSEREQRAFGNMMHIECVPCSSPHHLCRETEMAKISNPELKAAVSAIMKRDQSETPRQMSQRADLSALSRTHREWLQSEFAKAGFDFGRLEKLHSDYKKEAGRLIEKKMPSVDSKPVRPAKSDQKWTQNKKRVYELIGGRPLYTFPVVIDTPEAIYSVPAGALVDPHIESWNSWATWHHRVNPYGSDDARENFLKFLFAWQNNSPNPVVVKNASADISTRGFCSAQANPALPFTINSSTLFLSPYHRVHVGGTSISGDDFWVLYVRAVAGPDLFGGLVDLEAEDIDRVTSVRCRDIVIESKQIAIFEVGVRGYYTIRSTGGPAGGDGYVLYLFDGLGRRIACPSVTLDVTFGVHFP